MSASHLDRADRADRAGSTDRTDLRMPLLGAVAWVAALLTLLLPGLSGPQTGPVVLLLLAAGLTVAILAAGSRRRDPGGGARGSTWAAAAVVAAAVACSAAVQQHQVRHNPLADLAAEQAAVELTGEVTEDPHVVQGQFSEEVVVRLRVRTVAGRGWVHRLRAPLLVIGHGAWLHVPLGATVSVAGRLASATDGSRPQDVSALLVGGTPPRVVAPPSAVWRAAGAVRAAIRGSVAGRPSDQQALVPGLVDGDDAGLDQHLADDFRTTGLTHLTAVSGTNLTLVVGFLLWLARWCGVRGRWLTVVAAVGIVGFVLVARAEPSVLRAAVMGSVGLLALGHDGRHRALRGLGVAVTVLLLVDPALALSAGFALSALATAGIVLLGPGWRDALARWLPRPVAEAVAVPTAAQLTCTPLIAALAGQVSVVAVAANLLAEPVVGPATVLGLLGGLVGLLCPPLSRVLGWLAGWCVAWIAAVARHGAGLPVAALAWGRGPVALAALTALVVVGALIGPRLARRPRYAVPLAVLLTAVLLVRVPGLG